MNIPTLNNDNYPISESVNKILINYAALLEEKTRLHTLYEQYAETLRLIAAPMRPDGPYNRDRGACQILAEKALKIIWA